MKIQSISTLRPTMQTSAPGNMMLIAQPSQGVQSMQVSDAVVVSAFLDKILENYVKGEDSQFDSELYCPYTAQKHKRAVTCDQVDEPTRVRRRILELLYGNTNWRYTVTNAKDLPSSLYTAMCMYIKEDEWKQIFPRAVIPSQRTLEMDRLMSICTSPCQYDTLSSVESGAVKLPSEGGDGEGQAQRFRKPVFEKIGRSITLVEGSTRVLPQNPRALSAAVYCAAAYINDAHYNNLYHKARMVMRGEAEYLDGETQKLVESVCLFVCKNMLKTCPHGGDNPHEGFSADVVEVLKEKYARFMHIESILWNHSIRKSQLYLKIDYETKMPSMSCKEFCARYSSILYTNAKLHDLRKAVEQDPDRWIFLFTQESKESELKLHTSCRILSETWGALRSGGYHIFSFGGCTVLSIPVEDWKAITMGIIPMLCCSTKPYRSLPLPIHPILVHNLLRWKQGDDKRILEYSLLAVHKMCTSTAIKGFNGNSVRLMMEQRNLLRKIAFRFCLCDDLTVFLLSDQVEKIPGINLDARKMNRFRSLGKQWYFQQSVKGLMEPDTDHIMCGWGMMSLMEHVEKAEWDENNPLWKTMPREVTIVKRVFNSLKHQTRVGDYVWWNIDKSPPEEYDFPTCIAFYRLISNEHLPYVAALDAFLSMQTKPKDGHSATRPGIIKGVSNLKHLHTMGHLREYSRNCTFDGDEPMSPDGEPLAILIRCMESMAYTTRSSKEVPEFLIPDLNVMLPGRMVDYPLCVDNIGAVRASQVFPVWSSEFDINAPVPMSPSFINSILFYPIQTVTSTRLPLPQNQEGNSPLRIHEESKKYCINEPCCDNDMVLESPSNSSTESEESEDNNSEESPWETPGRGKAKKKRTN